MVILDKIKQRLAHYLFSEDLSRDARLLNMVCIVGFFAGLISLATRWAEHLPPFALGVMALYVVSVLVLFVIANYFDAHRVASWFTLIAVGDLLFPLTFFLTGGIDGALGVWFVFSLFAIFFFIRGATLFLFLGSHTLVIIACYVLSALHPEWLYALNSSQRLTEEFLAIFICGIFIGSAVKYLTSIYEAERKKAEAASRTKSTFLSAMSHEMRTPMNAIIGMTAIARATDDMAKKDYALDRIEEASEHLLGVINDILDMSKIEADKLELSYIEFSFSRMLQKVQTVINPRVDEKKLAFSVTVDEKIPDALISDDQRVTQVVINLLSNAVKFTDDNGKIALKASLLGEEDGLYEIQIEVADTGIGMNEEQIGRLFGSFEQAESGTSRKYGGTGLGLAISKNIVDLLGGSIRVKAKPGEGSQFFFTFKAQAGAGSTKDSLTGPTADALSGATPEAPEISLKGKRILLAEDIEINREIVLELLDSTGIEIDCANNGAEALEKFTAAPQSYDLILLDCMMPVMDGYEATQSIRALDVPQARTVPIVAMTANVFKEDVDKCLASGMNDHIGKPIDFNKLLAILRKNI
jgi:signal transduction histidine kinase